MRSIRLCEWGVALNPFATPEQVAKRLDEHAKVCPNHEAYKPPKKRAALRKRRGTR